MAARSPHNPAGRRASMSQSRMARDREASILKQRAELITEVERLRGRDDASRFVVNAQQLLTRWWSTASWPARENLLKTADWLIQLELRDSGLRSA
jgi:hypothetical protein